MNNGFYNWLKFRQLIYSIYFIRERNNATLLPNTRRKIDGRL